MSSVTLKILCTAFFCLLSLFSISQPAINIEGEGTSTIGKNFLLLEDSSNKLSIEDIIRSDESFKLNNKNVPSYSGTLSAVWVRFQLKNLSGEQYFLFIDNPTLDSLEFYSYVDGKVQFLQKTGDLFSFFERDIKRNNFIFRLDLKKDESKVFYIRYTGTEGMELPAEILSFKALVQKLNLLDLFHGIYYGIILVTIIYNLFLFISTKRRTYLYYVSFVGFFALLQAQLCGHTFQFLWPELPWFNTQCVFLFSSISGIFALQFGREFLQSKTSAPKLHGAGILLIFLWVFSIILSALSSFLSTKFILLNEYLVSASGLLFSPYMLAIGLSAYFKGYRPARFYLIAWSVILIGIVIFVLQSNGVIPHTFFTNNILKIGSALEAVLLSLALGDQYNLHKKEKEASQRILNLKLEKTNTELLKTNADLDNFVYTASHDLKAPISNIEGLIETLRSEPGYIESGMCEIIDMMAVSVGKFKETIADLTQITRIQKDIDEDQSVIDLPEMIKEIRELLIHQINGSNAEINIDLQECAEIRFSKKNFRSVLYNLISNALKYRSPERNPVILIMSECINEHVVLTIRDNGLGIGKHNQEKVFEMFKRAHNHVEGSGLGLYMVKRIMENNGGRIELESTEGKGSTFKVYFPAIIAEGTGTK